MDVDIDFVSEPAPPADAWAENQVTAHGPEDIDLAALVAEFTRNGGKIQEVAQGATAQNLTGAAAFNTFYVTTNVPEERVKARAEHNKTLNQRVNAKHYAGDAKLVERLKAMMADDPTRKEILDAMRMSDDRLQRLLSSYFADDRRADKYRKHSRDAQRSLESPRDAAMHAAIAPLLNAGHTLTQTSQLSGYSVNTVRRICVKYKLKVKAYRKSKVVQEV